MSSHPHGMRFSPFATANKTVILSAQQQPQQQTPIQQQPQVPLRQQQQRKSATPTNIPMPKPSVREVRKEMKNTGFSDTDDDEHEYFDEDDRSDNLSREERYVLLQPRAEPQGQENLSGNVTPVNENQSLNIYEKISQTPPATTAKLRYSSASTDSTNQHVNQRYSNRSVSVDLRNHEQTGGSQRNSLINRNSMDHPQSNRSSLDVSQSSYNTLIIHDNHDPQPLFQTPNNPPALIKHEFFYINPSPSPPNYGTKKEKSASRSFGGGSYSNAATGGEVMMTPITENEQQYLNQSYVLKHLAKEVKMSKNQPSQNQVDSTRDSGVSENNSSNNNNWFSVSPNDSGASSSSRNKSKSQPDLTKYCAGVQDETEQGSNSATNTLNFNDFEQLEVENNKLRQQLNDCLMKVAKSQKLEQEVTNIYRVHEELVQSCERRERLERTARGRLQNDCRRYQDLNLALRENVEMLQSQLIQATQQQQQQLSSSGRTQQDLLITQLIQQNKELVDANKRQYIEVQAQSATLEEQRIHINVLDNALKRLEEECRQKQIYQKQLQHALQSLQNANERRDKLRFELENELTKDINRGTAAAVASVNMTTTSSDPSSNLKWQLREKDNQIIRLEAECSKLEQQRNTMEDNQVRKMTMEKNSQETERMISEAQAQRKVSELQTRLKMVENRLAEKEKETIIRQLQGGNSVGNTYSLLNNNDCYTTSSSSIVSSAPTTPLIYQSTNYDQLMPPTSSGVSKNGQMSNAGTSNNSYDLLGNNGNSILDYSGLTAAGIYGHPNYGQKMPTPNVGMSPNTSCSSTTTAILQSQQQQINYDQSLDEQRKTIDDQLKQLDGALLSKICCFPSLGKKPVLSEEMSALTTNSSDAFLQNLAHLRNNRENTPTNSSNCGTKEEIVLLEKQGRSSQKLRSNLAQVSTMIGQNMTDISNIGNQSKLPKIVLPPRKDRQSSAPPSALPRPPRTLKPPRKIEYGRLSETDSSKSNTKSEYELKTSSLKRHQSPVSSTGSKNFIDIKNDLAMNTKGSLKNYGTMKSADTAANNITKIYYSNKPEFLTTSKNYQRLPDSPSSSDSLKRSFANGQGKKITFIRSSPNTQPPQIPSREGSVSSGSNSRTSPKPEAYQPLNRSRTRTPPKYLALNQGSPGGLSKLSYINSNQSSPTKVNLPSASVLHHAFQAQAQAQAQAAAASNDFRQQQQTHQRASSARSSGSGGENKYRIQF